MEKDDDDYCERMFESFKLNDKREITSQKRNLYTSIVNVVIVGTGLVVINRKKK